MRVIVLFDLPMETSAQRREYTKFRKNLITSGFMMMQKSIYVKLALNMTVANGIMESIRKNKPKYGLVQMLTVTENQFNRIEFVVGECENTTVDDTERIVVL